MNIKKLNELRKQLVNEFVGKDELDLISEIHNHEIFYNKENYNLIFNDVGINEFVEMVKDTLKAVNKKNEYEALKKDGKIIDENINSSCLDYVLITLSVAPHLKNNLDIIIEDINENPNTTNMVRDWEKQEVKKVTTLLKLLE